jgi:GAF domain-containing protein/HAMP domain-containing protein
MNTQSSDLPKREISLKTRLVISFIILGFVVVGLSFLLNYINLRQQLRTDIRQRLINIVSLAALQQNGDVFENIQSSQDSAFDQIRVQNLKIRSSDPDIRFVYTMRSDDDGLYFVVDAVEPGEAGASPYGTRYFEPGPILQTNYRNLTKPMVEDNFYTDEYGTFISAYAPIRTTAGKIVGIIGVDITANKVIAREAQLGYVLLGIFLISLPIIGGIGWILGSTLASPITALTQVAVRISEGELDYHPNIKIAGKEFRLLSNAFYSMANQLRSLINDLEQRVSDRTQAMERRATQIQTAADIGAAATKLRDLNILLKRAVDLISRRFGFYHVGIFLLDDAREYAILRAANSEGGQRMLAREHKLKVGQTGIVGYVTGEGQARIALDVGKDAVFFDNPDLPETRSEMALPLVIAGRILGALDVQSTQEAAFKDEDISTLKVLADQLAIAIENAHLFDENQKSLEATRRAYRERSREDWQRLLSDRGTEIGYISLVDDRVLTTPHETNIEFQQALESGKTILSEDGLILYLPIHARGHTIGAIKLEKPEKTMKWDDEDINLANLLSEQLGTALESARLYNDIRERAERESAITSITSKIGASIQLDTILRTAVEELGQTLEETEVVLQVGAQQKKGNLDE